MAKAVMRDSAWLTRKSEQSISQQEAGTSFLQAKAIAHIFGLTSRYVSVSFKVFINQPEPNLPVGHVQSGRKLSPFGDEFTLPNFGWLF